MAGSVYKRGSVYYAIYDGPPDINGKRKQKWLPCRHDNGKPMGKKEAEQKLASILTDISRGTHIDSDSSLLSEFLAHWLSISKPRLAATTLERYEDLVRVHISPAIGHIKLNKLKPMHIEKFLSEKQLGGRADGRTGGLAPKTVKHLHTLLHAALSQAVKWQIIAINPVDAVDVPRVTRPDIKVASEKEIATLMAAINGSRYRIPIILIIATGMRRGEVCGLQWSDFDPARRTLTIRHSLSQTREGLHFKETKTGSPRVILIPQSIVEDLLAWKHTQQLNGWSGEWICRNAVGSVITPKGLGLRYGEICRESGVKVTLHGLRHTQATNLIMSGVPVKIVAERLGHSTVSVTQDIYAHVLLHDQEQAMEVVEKMLKPQKPSIKLAG